MITVGMNSFAVGMAIQTWGSEMVHFVAVSSPRHQATLATQALKKMCCADSFLHSIVSDPDSDPEDTSRHLHDFGKLGGIERFS